MTSFTPEELAAYLDEALPTADMVRIEQGLRSDAALLDDLAEIRARRDSGTHSVGEIWRRHRLTCLTRDQLGSYLLGVLDEPQSAYVKLHLETVGCRYCQANVDDLRRQQSEKGAASDARRRKYFQSSAGHLARGRA